MAPAPRPTVVCLLASILLYRTTLLRHTAPSQTPPHLSTSLPSLSPLQALEMYTKAAQEDGDAPRGYRVSLMALKCLNNAVWDQPAGQLAFVRLGGLDMLVGLMQVQYRDSSVRAGMAPAW